ncbi:MAG: UDP-N-acetylmuramate dehydrogenase [Acidimicrobiia bacterium]
MSTPAPIEAVAGRLGGLARWDEPLGARTTYRVGGRARLLVEVAGEADLGRVAAAVASAGIDVLVVGRGSNLLVADAGFDGLAVLLGGGFAEISVEPGSGSGSGRAMVEAGGAVSLPVLARATAGAGLTGLEWAVGVPGSVGGAVRMNAGGHGSDVAATLREVRVVDLATGEDGSMSAGDLALGYRRSALGPSQVVVAARFELRPGDPEVSAAAIAEIVTWRRANQPGGQNAGSVFTNPPGDSAGRLVEAAGCRGLRWGTAQVSPKHANFIQADPGGSADDVRALIEVVRARVAAATGIRLETELRLVGFDPPSAPDPLPLAEVEG